MDTVYTRHHVKANDNQRIAQRRDEFNRERVEALLNKEEPLQCKLEREIILKMQLGCSLKLYLLQSEFSYEFRNGNGTRNRSISNLLDALKSHSRVKSKYVHMSVTRKTCFKILIFYINLEAYYLYHNFSICAFFIEKFKVIK